MNGGRQRRDGRRGSRRAGLDSERFDEALERVDKRGRSAGRARIQQLQIKFLLAVQAGLAAALAWAAARWLTGMPSPIFAPAAAVAVITSSLGQRLTSTIELLAGVTLGIFVSDLLIEVTGVGVWQTGVIVAAAILVALALSTRGGVVGNASGTAVLLGALSSSRHTLEFPRFIDAVIGGGVGLAVTLLLLPINPLRIMRRVAAPTLRQLADQLGQTASALRSRDHELANRALNRSQGVGAELGRFWDAFGGAKETVNFAPARWPWRRAVRHYQLGAPEVDQTVWNTRVLARRVVVLIEDGEPIPEGLPNAVDELGAAVHALQNEVLSGWSPEATRRHALRAVAHATQAELAGTHLSGTVIVGQVRTAASDVLQATGMDRTEALRRIREVASAQSDPHRNPPAG
ncbi:FUSC family protein [Micromonospora musae]|uniref:Aromatic acid exporter family protein n=1 Tax=Micromonospora musae TaxID=1894970 RepID=A0A3A9XWI8_9ACTN|nr:FUSC family protein [Micromonospora musae]RKN29521.1 aromatic acid exporter family protein [Micromonospora musae]